MLGSSFYSQLWLIPCIKLTFIKGELLFIISKRQFPIQLCFAMTVNKSQGQFFNFIGVNLQILAFIYSQLYITLSQVITVNGISVLLPLN